MRTLSTLTFLLFGLFAFAQADNAKIIKIRKAVEQINKDSGYTVKKLSDEEFLEQATDNGGQLSGYFKNGQLVKMVEWIGLSSCVNVTEYYLQNNQLIFTYTKGSESPYIESSQSFDQSKFKKTMDCRFYFDNGKLVKSIFFGATRCGGKPTDALAKDDLEECSRDIKLLTKK
jgi:hypothetical protein